MGLFNRKKNANEERSFFPEGSRPVFAPLLFTSEKNPTVSACVNKICNTLSILPIQLYAHTKKGKRLAISNPLFRVLEKPAFEETPSLFYNSLYRQLLLEGNVYIYLGRNNRGEIVNFSLIDPAKVKVERDDSFRKIFYISGKIYTERDILHIPYIGAGYNGTVGISPVRVHRELIDLDNNLLTYINNYFNNSLGSRYAIKLGDSYPNKTQDLAATYAAILPVINKYVAGSSNAGKVMVPPPDSELMKIEQSSNVQAQLDSLLEMVERQIAEAFNVPYEVISGENKYNSLETKQNDFLTNCIQPLGKHVCESFERLIDPSDTALFITYEYKNLLTTNTSDTINYLSKELQSGMLSLNEARSKLGMEDIGSAGDVFWMPANLIPVTEENIEAILAKSKLALQEASAIEKNEEHSVAGDDKT